MYYRMPVNTIRALGVIAQASGLRFSSWPDETAGDLEARSTGSTAIGLYGYSGVITLRGAAS